MRLNIRQKGINHESVTEVLKCKWTILILTKITEGLSRPSQLKKAIPGITTKVLNDRLKRLEREGVLQRKSFSGYPLRVEYLLDLRGRELKPIINEIKSADIPVDFITEVISCKWMFEILSILRKSSMRTNQLKKHIIGISNKILSERLRKLEQMGFIYRDVIDAVPPGVIYSLTNRGEEFIRFMETKDLPPTTQTYT
ncbi:MAG TPA: helix-turn-helix domain-containing protein [Thermodesulfobacteriota bacterium]|nr:helix-turn-helix domain-containing protein [Thermodesulfobacteriota bacterium]